MIRFTMPRAGRPVNTLVSAVFAGGIALQCGAMDGAGGGFRAQQIGGADLHAGGAERQRRGDAFRIGNAAGRDDRHAHGLHHLRHQRERADLAGEIVGQEMPRWPPASRPCAMTASTPRASSQRASSTVVADDRIFAPQRTHTRQQFRRRQAEMKAHDRRARIRSRTSADCRIERHARRARRRSTADRCRIPRSRAQAPPATPLHARRRARGAGGRRS